jgi:hypothetical protein
MFFLLRASVSSKFPEIKLSKWATAWSSSLFPSLIKPGKVKKIFIHFSFFQFYPNRQIFISIFVMLSLKFLWKINTPLIFNVWQSIPEWKTSSYIKYSKYKLKYLYIHHQDFIWIILIKAFRIRAWRRRF